MQFIDLEAQQKLIHQGLEERIRTVLTHGKYILGPEVYELEEELAKLAGVRHCLSCSSGTDALLICLMAHDIGPGDAVLTSPFTFMASAETISLLGATPVFVDIDESTFNLDPACLERAVRALKANDPAIYPLPRRKESNKDSAATTLQPRGIVAVDLFGLPADYGPIGRVAAEHGLFVIEDAAQSFGAAYQGKQAGSLADMAGTSFYPAKPLGCYGDGGALFTDNDDLARIAESIRVHGQGEDKYDNVRIGINGRMDTLQAAILLEKLKIFPKEIQERNRIASRYSHQLEGSVDIPFLPEGCTSVWAQYSVMSDHRDTMIEKLTREDIPMAIHYSKPLHLQTAFSYLGYQQGDFPVSEKVSKRIFSLPMHPYLKDEDIDKITNILRSSTKR